MAGRNAARALETPVNAKPVVHCDEVGCEQRAFSRVGDRNLCQACIARKEHERAVAACMAKGLDTVEKQKSYCRQLMRSFGRRRPSFEQWAETITQEAVDRLALMGGQSDQAVLEKLRAFGAIDGRNRVIPAGEPRRIAAEAVRAERARQIAKAQEDLQRLAEKFGPLNVPAGEPEVKA